MRLLAAALPLFLVSSAYAQDPLCDRLRAITVEPTVASAHWGISVVSADGSPVCGIDDSQLFRPASNNKLFTTSAAFALLGPDRTVQTRVLGNFDPATGVVTGDLILEGGADANLDSGDLPYLLPAQRHAAPPFAFRDLQALAAQLAARGVRSVTGDLLGDDTFFPYEPYPPSWNADDLVWGYGAPVSALTIADNQLKLLVTPGRIAGPPGYQSFSPATVTLDQHGIAYYTLQAEVETRPKGSAGLGVGVERMPGLRMLRVYGSVAEDAADSEEIAIDDPALYAAMAFRTVLAQQGITVRGTSRAKHKRVRDGAGFLEELRAPGGSEELTVAGEEGGGSCVEPVHLPVLATHVSAPLAQDVTFTNKTSQNLHAELLLHRLGQRVFCGQGSDVAGSRMVRAFLLHAGVDPKDFILYDGSGLSDHDLVTPRAFTRLLTFASAQPWFAEWKATLPVGGVDGSLASRFPGPLKGHIVAKTGTLGESRALSGYVASASGQVLLFSILVDTHLPGTADRAAMDRIVQEIAAE